jgi:DNA-binding response OmpR family regulator
MKKIKVHMFCMKPDICSLIKKVFSSTQYELSCTSAVNVNERFLSSGHINADCIILDIDIDTETKNNIKKRFTGIPVICLPSLDSEVIKDTAVKYISEPLKLSELRRTLDEIFHPA